MEAAFGDDNPLLNELFDYKQLPGDDRQKFADVENELYRRVLETEIARLNEIVKTASDKNEIIERIGKLSTERSKLTKYRS